MILWLNEWVFKLASFFAVGYVFIFLDIFFLSLTEDFPLRRMSFNIVNYFPLSYGMFLPILMFFFSSPYYPVGSPRYRDFPFSFELEHTGNKLFSYLMLMLLFLMSLELSLFSFQDYDHLILNYLWWFYQVFFAFLIFQLIPLYPSLMGVAILKEIKRYLIKQKKMQQADRLILIAEISSYFFIFLAISLNYSSFNQQIENFLMLLLQLLNTPIFFAFIGFILSLVFCIFYVKKREYDRYLEYIKNLLKDAFLKEKDPSN